MQSKPGNPASNGAIALGVSACLLGQEVRYDGRHKRHDLIAESLARYFALTPLCPEVAIGLGVPRPPLQLTGDPNQPRVRGVEDPAMDVTEPLQAYGADAARQYPALRGYIFKSRSPSCGAWDTPILNADNEPVAVGRGVFAAAWSRARPLLPLIDEQRLEHAESYASFIYQVSVYDRWLAEYEPGISAEGLRGFHERHRLLIMAYSPDHVQAFDELAAGAGMEDGRDKAERYIADLMRILQPPLRGTRHARVLSHIAEQAGVVPGSGEHERLSGAIAGYRQDRLPWSAPVAVLQERLRDLPELARQARALLDPHPAFGLVQPYAESINEVML